MRYGQQFLRFLATASFLVAATIGSVPTASALPQNDDGDGGAIYADPLPPPSGDLAGHKPPADSLVPLAPTPYPDTSLILGSYTLREPSDFFTASSEGVWFSTPLGLNCGIWDRGSFGCVGDIRGAPPGTTRIGWINGSIVTRYDAYDPLLRFQFPPGQAEKALPPRSYVEWNGTQCATMGDSSTYCVRGAFKFFVTAAGTYLSPP